MRHGWLPTAALAAAVMLAVPVVPSFAQERGHEQDMRDHNTRGGHDERDRGHEERGPAARGPERGRSEARSRPQFDTHQRDMAHRYYTDYGHNHRGRCPPGLARKHNGCEAPGHAKRWQVGRPLPRDVVYYNVPQPLVQQLGPPPRGDRYARVSNDILLLALGTGIVVDALQNLGQQ